MSILFLHLDFVTFNCVTMFIDWLLSTFLRRDYEESFSSFAQFRAKLSWRQESIKHGQVDNPQFSLSFPLPSWFIPPITCLIYCDLTKFDLF